MVDQDVRREQKRLAQARYRQSVKGQAKIKAYRKSDASKATNARWYAENRYKAAAHTLVQRAVAAGRMTKQPCEVCGAEKVHAHHDDYEKPLEVRWLCPTHHKVAHRK
jgi:hypothetical protein